jgi:hypothetical protein
VTSTTTEHANKSFLYCLRGFFSFLSLGFERWLWIGWVVSFGGFECFLLFVVVGAGNTLLTFVLTSLKGNTQFVCGLGCTLFYTVHVILNYLLAHHSFLKMRSQIGNLLF